jgi:hypothetical protein
MSRYVIPFLASFAVLGFVVALERMGSSEDGRAANASNDE